MLDSLLFCCNIGEMAKGRQWHNRDTGFGICAKCADWNAETESDEYLLECFGKRGFHYDIAD